METLFPRISTMPRLTESDLLKMGFDRDGKRISKPTGQPAGGSRLNQVAKADKPNKYRNKRCVIDGIKFDSQKEGARYGILRLMERKGEITQLQLQVTYNLVVNGILVCKYRCDFEYVRDGVKITEDVKGKLTREYIIKRNLMKACHRIVILET